MSTQNQISSKENLFYNRPIFRNLLIFQVKQLLIAETKYAGKYQMLSGALMNHVFIKIFVKLTSLHHLQVWW